MLATKIDIVISLVIPFTLPNNLNLIEHKIESVFSQFFFKTALSKYWPSGFGSVLCSLRNRAQDMNLLKIKSTVTVVIFKLNLFQSPLKFSF